MLCLYHNCGWIWPSRIRLYLPKARIRCSLPLDPQYSEFYGEEGEKHSSSVMSLCSGPRPATSDLCYYNQTTSFRKTLVPVFEIRTRSVFPNCWSMPWKLTNNIRISDLLSWGNFFRNPACPPGNLLCLLQNPPLNAVFLWSSPWSILSKRIHAFLFSSTLLFKLLYQSTHFIAPTSFHVCLPATTWTLKHWHLVPLSLHMHDQTQV